MHRWFITIKYLLYICCNDLKIFSLLWLEELVMVCCTFLPCLPFQHILITSCCLILSPFLTVSSPLWQAGHSPLTSKWYPKYIMWYDTSPLATQDFRADQSSWQVRTQVAHSLAEFNGCTRGDYAFFQLSGFKTCSSAVKPLWQSRTWRLPMSLNGLHLLHSSVYSEHDFIHDLLIKQITVNSFLKTHYLYINWLFTN